MDIETAAIQNELENKINSLRHLMEASEVDAVLLQRSSSFSWATCGADPHINTAASDGAAMLLITPSEKYVLTDNIEASRLEQEEGLFLQGWTFKVSPWYGPDGAARVLTSGRRTGTDGLYPVGKDLSRELAWLRAQLSENETARFRILGELCGKSMQEAVYSIQPGMSEYEIAGLLSGAAESNGVQAVVNLVGTDERIFNYRHPIPTARKLDRYAMVVLCGRKWGLVCSVTRLVHFGAVPEEIRSRTRAVAEIDAFMITRTRPGRTIADVFSSTQQAYSRLGYPGEWQNHHQGGLAGYEPREIVATQDTHQPVAVGQAYAWNPSVSGAKSEDTILVEPWANEVLTETPGWPMLEIRIDDKCVKRPDILERDSV
ncbi:MAG: aminopeptidase P family protein [Anaerolineales bacterium]|nr:aminopeptidase P family protein [Anaerolineales bacterium]